MRCKKISQIARLISAALVATLNCGWQHKRSRPFTTPNAMTVAHAVGPGANDYPRSHRGTSIRHGRRELPEDREARSSAGRYFVSKKTGNLISRQRTDRVRKRLRAIPHSAFAHSPALVYCSGGTRHRR